MLYKLVWLFVSIQSMGLAALMIQVAVDRRVIRRNLESRGRRLRWLSWAPFRYQVLKEVGDRWEERPTTVGRAYRVTYVECNSPARHDAICMLGSGERVFWSRAKDESKPSETSPERKAA